MEKITCICVMRELMMALSDFENKLMDAHGVSLNEAMVLCSVLLKKVQVLISIHHLYDF